MQVFHDKNGTPIKEGDVLIRRFFVRKRERHGKFRVAYDMMGNPVTQLDEGRIVSRDPAWVKVRVEWSGACLVVRRCAVSDELLLSWSVECEDGDGKFVSALSAGEYMNCAFDGSKYEICNDSVPEGTEE